MALMPSFCRRIIEAAIIIICSIDNSVKETAGGCDSYAIEITRSK